MKKVLVALGVVAVAAIFLVKPILLSREAARFEPKLKEYEALMLPPDPAGVSEGELVFSRDALTVDASRLARRSGKLFVVKQRKTGTLVFAEDRVPQVDDAWYGLGGALRASSPEEVGTLVQVAYSLEEAQGYVDGNKPFQTPAIPGMARRPDVKAVLGRRAATIRVLDLKRQLLVGVWRLIGEPPPDTVQVNEIEKVMAAPPVSKFVAALPER